jgi:radial spoke head protein 4/6
LMKALKRLAKETGASSVRLWGKIRGTKSDYYVAEGVYDGNQGEEEKPADFEARGTGINKFVYWVSANATLPFVQLPDLQPKDIKAAQQTKVLITGNKDADITTNPFFFGKEMHFLRAQIARITHSTTICPKGVYKLVEDSEREIEDNVPEEGPIPIPSTPEMCSPSNWVHYTQNILGACRLTHLEPDVPEGFEGDPEDLKKALEAKDPYEKRLKPINLDKSVKGGFPAWVVRMYGDSTSYVDANPAVKKPLNYGVVVAKSLWWPGAYSFFTNGRWL